jgi:hypothetical protein
VGYGCKVNPEVVRESLQELELRRRERLNAAEALPLNFWGVVRRGAVVGYPASVADCWWEQMPSADCRRIESAYVHVAPFFRAV